MVGAAAKEAALNIRLPWDVVNQYQGLAGAIKEMAGLAARALCSYEFEPIKGKREPRSKQNIVIDNNLLLYIPCRSKCPHTRIPVCHSLQRNT